MYTKIMKNNLIVTIIVLIIVFAAAAFWFNKPKMDAEKITVTENTPNVQNEDSNSKNESIAGSYNNEDFGLSFNYPSSWFGPEEYENAETLRVEVGSDTVYPYGTSPEDRVRTIPASYFVILQLDDNNHPNEFAMQQLEDLKKMKVEEESSDQRNKLIKIRDINENGLTGVEYISTVSESAQSEFYYTRSAVLQNSEGKILIINANVENVTIPENATRKDWMEIFSEADKNNIQYFRMILDTVKF